MKNEPVISLKSSKIRTCFTNPQLLNYIKKGLLANPICRPEEKLCWIRIDVEHFQNILNDINSKRKINNFINQSKQINP